MTTPHGFISVFAPELEAYLTFKTAMGCYGTSRIWYLRQFDAYCARHGATTFDRDTIEGWVVEQLRHSGRYRSWMSYIRDVGRWLQTHGHTDAYVLSDRWKAPFVPAHPYLLTREEIDAFFTATAHLDTPCPWQWQAAAFFTLMHSCGLRTGEVRALATEQVNRRARYVDIVWSKGNRSRRLPLTDQVIEVLTTCDRATRHQFGTRATFFVSATGNPVTAATVGVWFNRIWDQAELPRPAAAGPQPCPYSFRHHFAYANIERWMTQGADVTAMLPYLSRYMGHATFESTYYYVHTSPGFMRAYADLADQSQSLLPEVGFE
ncbi:MAG: integrase [Actinobacteria bacterium]|nr:integrase [Actinomycetota bacterium]